MAISLAKFEENVFFLSSLSPDEDPLCVLLMIDFYALHSEEYEFIIRIYDEWEVRDEGIFSNPPSPSFFFPFLSSSFLPFLLSSFPLLTASVFYFFRPIKISLSCLILLFLFPWLIFIVRNLRTHLPLLMTW